MSKLRERYFNTLGIEKDSSSRKRLENALSRAYELRSFEIELYWKRATFFWGFQVAIFAAFGLIWREGAPEKAPGSITIALSLLGAATGAINYLSAKGSKFWQTNWEHHIDMLENEIDGRLYKTVWLDRDRGSFSVSKLHQATALAVLAFWAYIFVISCINAFGYNEPSGTVIRTTAGLIIILLALIFICLELRITSDLKGSVPDDNGRHGDTAYDFRFNESPPKFIRRYSQDEM